jgi:hypothetical protein
MTNVEPLPGCDSTASRARCRARLGLPAT